MQFISNKCFSLNLSERLSSSCCRQRMIHFPMSQCLSILKSENFWIWVDQMKVRQNADHRISTGFAVLKISVMFLRSLRIHGIIYVPIQGSCYQLANRRNTSSRIKSWNMFFECGQEGQSVTRDYWVFYNKFLIITMCSTCWQWHSSKSLKMTGKMK